MFEKFFFRVKVRSFFVKSNFLHYFFNRIDIFLAVGFAVGGVVIVVVVSCPNADQGILVAYAFGIVFILNVNLVV